MLLIACQPAGRVARTMSPRTHRPVSDAPHGRLVRCAIGLVILAVASSTGLAAGVAPQKTASALVQAAESETDPEVRAQLAATARRLPARQGLPVAAALLARDGDSTDPYIPLLCWWALEHHLAANREDVLALFADPAFWDRLMVFEHILPRLMRRFAAEGRRQDLLVCARLLQQAPGPKHRARLLSGFEEAFRGRVLTGLPDELVTALAKAGGGSLILRLRQGEAGAIAEALAVVVNPKARPDDRLLYARALGELRVSNSVPALLNLATNDASPAIRRAALASLGAFEDGAVATSIAEALPQFSDEVRPAAFGLLTSRTASCLILLQSLKSGNVSLSNVPAEIVERLRTHPAPSVRDLATTLFGDSNAGPPTELARRIGAVESALQSGPGNPYAGEPLFMQRCAACHKLFFKGGHVGPDLTPYQRDTLGTLLLSILNPNAEIREGYAAVEVETKDGRSLTGFVADRDANALVLRTLDGESTTLRPSEIDSLQPTGRSLMPEGLLDGLSDQQLRDLFAYLRSSQPMTK
jgi:putative heme-binding domain-containing protein